MLISVIIISSVMILYDYKLLMKSNNKNKKTFMCIVSIIAFSFILVLITKFFPTVSLVKISLYITERVFPTFLEFMKK